MNKDGLEGRAEEVHGEEGKRVFHQDLLIFLGMGRRVRRGHSR